MSSLVVSGSVQSEQLSIGIGFSPRVNIEDVIRLVRLSVHSISPDTLLATIDRRASMAGAIAAVLGIRLVVFPSSVLANVAGVTTQSALALSSTHTANVAEASALASLGPSACLIVTQKKGRLCTCAVAAIRTAVHPPVLP